MALSGYRIAVEAFLGLGEGSLDPMSRATIWATDGPMGSTRWS
jgi:hypothetical protein